MFPLRTSDYANGLMDATICSRIKRISRKYGSAVPDASLFFMKFSVRHKKIFIVHVIKKYAVI